MESAYYAVLLQASPRTRGNKMRLSFALGSETQLMATSAFELSLNDGTF
jgi:hypothetical protein